MKDKWVIISGLLIISTFVLGLNTNIDSSAVDQKLELKKDQSSRFSREFISDLHSEKSDPLYYKVRKTAAVHQTVEDLQRQDFSSLKEAKLWLDKRNKYLTNKKIVLSISEWEKILDFYVGSQVAKAQTENWSDEIFINENKIKD